jgi:TolB-like protein
MPFWDGIKHLEVFMKKSFITFLILAAVFLVSCISLQDREMTSEHLQLKVLGEVQTYFTSFHFLHIQIHPAIKKIAYNRLLDEAKKKYASQHGADNLDVMNITINEIYTWPVELAEAPVAFGLLFPVLAPVMILCDWQDLKIKGTVVINPNKQKRKDTPKTSINIKALENAVDTISKTLVERIPNGSTIAVLSIAGTTNAGQIIDELEFQLVKKGQNFSVVERRLLAQIRLEQGFQMSGDVSDESAVSIGHMLGANIVVTGNITDTENKQRLTVKALDVKTAQIVAIERSDF